MMKNDDWICTWSRKLHDRPRVHSMSHPADERDTPVQRLNTGHNTLLLPSGHFEMEKRWPIFCLISQAARRCTRPSARRATQCVAASWQEGHSRFEDSTHFYCPCLVCCALNQSWVIKWVCVVHTTHFYCPPVTLKWKSDDLFFAWSRKLHDGARGPRLGWWEGHNRFEDCTHHTFVAPFWCAVPWICHENLSWVIKCVGVCVCVCTDSLQAGFPNRFLRFLHLSSVFSTYPNAHAAKISVFFLSTCLFLLPCSQTCMLPLPFSACFPCLAWICVPPSCQIRLLDLEPNTAVNTVRAKSKHHEVLARSIKKQRCLLCSCERSCSFPIKNGLLRNG